MANVSEEKVSEVPQRRKWIIYGLVLASTTLQSMVSAGLVNASFSTLEKRFSVSSKWIGVISGWAHAGVLLATLPVSYVGENKRAPKLLILGASMIVTGIASGMFWLTNYVDQPPQTNPVASDAICRPADGSVARSLASRSPSASNPDAAVAILSVGNFICGIGTAAFYPVGNTYLHDLFPEENLKIWIAVWQTTFFVGAALGFTLEGLALKLDTGNSAGGASFLGAWWLPFAVSAFVCIGLGIVMAVGEKCLKMPFQLTEEEARETGEVGRGRPAGFRKTASGVWNKLWRSTAGVFVSSYQLLKRPTFSLVVLGMATDVSINSALSPFLPKFTENQFNLSPSASAMAVGIPVTAAVLIGTVAGSAISARMRLGARGLTVFYILAHVAVLLVGPFFLLKCPKREFAGVGPSVGSLGRGVLNTSSLYEACNAGCNCSDVFEPACGSSNASSIFYNPCFAGCGRRDPSQGGVFRDCRCVGDAGVEQQLQVTVGECSPVCNEIYLFLFLLTLIMILFYMPNATNVFLLGLSGPAEQRTFATGLQTVLGRLVAGIPSPLAYGGIIESTCLLKADKCVLYDTHLLGLYSTIFLTAIKAAGVLFFLVALPLTTPRGKTDL